MSGIDWLHRAVGRFVPGTSIWQFDEWDVCCILDGCRVDTFREFRDCETYRSVASSSRQWLQRTFRHAPDGVAYVTGNPFLDDVDTSALAYVHQEPVCEVGGVETVPPRAVANHAAALWHDSERFGVEKLVVHFMQPHVPFRARPEWFNRFSGSEVWGSCRWNALADGDIRRKAWFDAYRDNLAWVLTEGVDRLAERVDARVAVTADHGNAAGEWGVYGHPRGVAVPTVRRVPWHLTHAKQSKPVPDIELTGETVDDRQQQLFALGYT